nr:hypothetical protein [Opitutaceae bacterium]
SLEFRRQADRALDGIVYQVETATAAGGPWQALAGDAAVVVSTEGSIEVVRIELPALAPATFARLRVTR